MDSIEREYLLQVIPMLIEGCILEQVEEGHTYSNNLCNNILLTKSFMECPYNRLIWSYRGAGNNEFVDNVCDITRESNPIMSLILDT